MENGINIDLMKDIQKIQYLFILLPLITFIYYKINIWLIILYTMSVAIHSLYIRIFHVFEKRTTDTTIYRKEKSLKELDYIPFIWLWITVVIINISAFVYSFILSVINLSGENKYTLTLLLLHVFIATFQIFILFVINYLRKLVPKWQKNKKQN